ncbi:hypothetical protein GGR21_002066 [Dysgonomonas hofstadii]|uniref:Uncharacterized protein n=1 Tax=Dysgonomonas hofstadii TaxID=637886 RepID=A0A840CTG5_9BACT|nr:hypothetical protein [Dysgonomonas hofstadii]MBB4036165.1 hypothetical protein [Dysgonomonas hofstadii]
MDENILNLLHSLIEEGNILINEIHPMPPTPGIIRLTTVYYVDDAGKYANWKSSVKRFLKINFPEDCEEMENIEKYNFSPDTHKQIVGLLVAIQKMPQIVKRVENVNKNAIHITNNLSQNQEQNQLITLNIFIESIENELTKRQFDELKQVVHEYKDSPKEGKENVLNKLKSFGNDVLSNIIANIITSPTIWG